MMNLRHEMCWKKDLKVAVMEVLLNRDVNDMQQATSTVLEAIKEIFYSFSAIDALILKTIELSIKETKNGLDFQITLIGHNKGSKIVSQKMHMKLKEGIKVDFDFLKDYCEKGKLKCSKHEDGIELRLSDF